MHQEGIYPGSGMQAEVGNMEGLGYTLNVPLPSGSGDVAMQSVFRELVRPAAQRFDPDLILVSAGFDAHICDPLADMQCTSYGYFSLTSNLSDLANELCDGHLVFFLEGGYNLNALAGSAANVFSALLGMSHIYTPESAPSPEPNVDPLISNIKAMHKL
jgi:acetoin utilization deacetylase AcuC-like enzyme